MTRQLIISALLAAAGCDSDDPDAKSADNTKNNAADRDAVAKTPLDQSQDGEDVDLTANIRSQLMEDDSLSRDARNVKIVTTEGLVTLRGPVASEGERNTIARIAQLAAGSRRIDNQLEVSAQ